jgi:hypothetical protein
MNSASLWRQRVAESIAYVILQMEGNAPGWAKVGKSHLDIELSRSTWEPSALRRKNIAPVVIGAAPSTPTSKVGMMLSPNGTKQATRATRALSAYRSVAIRPSY